MNEIVWVRTANSTKGNFEGKKKECKIFISALSNKIGNILRVFDKNKRV